MEQLLKVTNENSETIEIEFDDDGNIEIRHSDVDPKQWGALHDGSKRFNQPRIQEFMKEKGVNMDSPEVKELIKKFGGYMVIHDKTYVINDKELALIYDAVRKAGGIAPNWSNRP